MSLVNTANHYYFQECRYMPQPLALGLTTSTTILNGITGNVAWLFFTVRYTSALTGLGTIAYLPISNFSLLGSDGSNICGGTAITSSMNLQIMNRYNTLSSYTSENSLGITNNGANVYFFPFTVDPITQDSTGQHYGSRTFTGIEQLLITFTTALTATAQIDIYASVEGVIEQTPL